ncbi:MAG: Gfo/Idh/MocA family protein [Kiritimatiellia bacterium]|jgi:scyllo-inositol 2-dehydrogenase (NADP+)
MADVNPLPIRVGIVGLGRAGWGMHCRELDEYPELFRVVAVCDIDKARRDAAFAKYRCRTYRQYADLLRDIDVELVDIATRSDDHFGHALEALKTGRSVLLEKPMSLDLAEAIKLRAAAIRAGNRLYIRHNRRFEPLFLHVREIIESGMLGVVYDVKLRRGSFSRRNDWQTVKRCGGGQLLNWGPHIVDHALQLLGPQAKLVFSDLKRVAAVGDAEDYVHLVLRNPGGLTVDIEISGGRILPEPEYLVSGTKGSLSASGSTIHIRRLDPAHALPRRRASVRTPPLGSFGTPEKLKWIEEDIPVAPRQPSGMTYMWPLLHDAIRNGKPYPITLDEAVDVMRVLSAARHG